MEHSNQSQPNPVRDLLGHPVCILRPNVGRIMQARRGEDIKSESGMWPGYDPALQGKTGISYRFGPPGMIASCNYKKFPLLVAPSWQLNVTRFCTSEPFVARGDQKSL